jgi:phosphate transport system substrate-binding protein
MRRKATLIAALLAFALVAAACGGSSDDTTTTGGGGGDTLTGSINISGSSTVEPISALNAEKFNAMHPEVGISVSGPGTSDGFAQFCSGETDISDASRKIRDLEIEECAANGVEYIELLIAIDGLSVLTSTANDFASCLTFNDLYALLGPESTGFSNWSDADALAAELGGTNAPYPDAPLVVTAPGEESGTFDSFVEIVIDGIADDRGQDGTTRPDYVASANDNVIIEGIAGTPSSLGWVGYAFFLANQDVVKALAIDDGETGCVEPTPSSIADGSYPIARPLFIYVKTEAADRPEIAAYVDLYLSEEGFASIDQTGYIKLASYDDAIARWQSRTTGPA